MRSLAKFIFYVINWNRAHDHFLLLPFEKRDRLRLIARQFDPAVFVETGSFHGDTAIALSSVVPSVISLEIDPKNVVVARTNCADQSNIEIHEGSSEVLLPDILHRLHGRVMFWLDAHYQKNMLLGAHRCPLFDELDAILSCKQLEPLIVVDDARKFIWANGWPSLNSIRKFVSKRRSDFDFRVSHDMIHIGRFEM